MSLFPSSLYLPRHFSHLFAPSFIACLTKDSRPEVAIRSEAMSLTFTESRKGGNYFRHQCDMEVCVDSVTSAVNAEKGGASRLELCSNLIEGGTTPSVGLLTVVKSRVEIPVFVMLRPRGGDFLYTDAEVEVMKTDLKVLKEAKADGFVFGFLNQDGSVDADLCREFKELAAPLPVTFHRAIDMSSNVFASLQTLIELKFDRVLTSGGSATALDGAPIIEKMIKESREMIIVMPGGGINEDNLERILALGAKEFHCSARIAKESEMLHQKSGISLGGTLSPPEYGRKVASVMKVRNMLNRAAMHWDGCKE